MQAVFCDLVIASKVRAVHTWWADKFLLAIRRGQDLVNGNSLAQLNSFWCAYSTRGCQSCEDGCPTTLEPAVWTPWGWGSLRTLAMRSAKYFHSQTQRPGTLEGEYHIRRHSSGFNQNRRLSHRKL